MKLRRFCTLENT